MSPRISTIIDFGATYDIVDMTTGENLGAAQRKGLKSIIKDTWKILDANGNEYVGGFKIGKEHGTGRFTGNTGNEYVGEYKYGVINGQGTFTYLYG